MPADTYGQSLTGLTVNILVRDIDTSLRFQREVLGATVVYSDPDFAVLEGFDSQWMLHADHTYSDHPLSGVVSGLEGRGAGVELRLHGCDPDQAEAAARRLCYTVFQGTADKPHGLREAFIIDDDGYMWVPDIPIA